MTETHPNFSTPNTALSDHNGWYSEASVTNLRRKAAEEVLRILTGHPPRNPVVAPCALRSLKGCGMILVEPCAARRDLALARRRRVYAARTPRHPRLGA